MSVESRRLKQATLVLQACENQVERADKLCAGSSLMADGDEMGAAAATWYVCGERPTMPLIVRCEQLTLKNLLEGLSGKTRRRHGLLCS